MSARTALANVVGKVFVFFRDGAQILAFSLIGATATLAQGTADITGSVTDPTGAAITGATITVTNTATSARRIATSNEAGIYDIPALVPGKYDMIVEAPGFRNTERKDIELQVAQVARLDFPMHLAMSPTPSR